MLFNSLEFIFIFLPIAFFIYFYLCKIKSLAASKIWLILASLFFYGYWNKANLTLLLISIIFNFLTGLALKQKDLEYFKRKVILFAGISANLALLVYFKYSNFLIQSISTLTSNDYNFYNIALPLGISFFTFTQIAYLVDTYKEGTEKVVRFFKKHVQSTSKLIH